MGADDPLERELGQRVEDDARRGVVVVGDHRARLLVAAAEQQLVAGQAGVPEESGPGRFSQDSALSGQPVTVQRQVQAGQQCPLGGQIPVPVAGPGGLEGRPPRRVPDLVRPFPAHVEFVTGAVTGTEDQIRPVDRGRGERPVRGDQVRGLPQPRAVPLPEPGLLRRRHFQPLAGQSQLLQRRRHRPGEPGQPEPPAPGVAARHQGAVDVHRAVPFGPDERVRHGRVPVIGADHRDDLQPAGLTAGHVQAELGFLVPGQRAAIARVYQLKASRRGLVKQRPELA